MTKIAFTACMDAERVLDQPDWDQIQWEDPDAFMLSGGPPRTYDPRPYDFRLDKGNRAAESPQQASSEGLLSPDGHGVFHVQ